MIGVLRETEQIKSTNYLSLCFWIIFFCVCAAVCFCCVTTLASVTDVWISGRHLIALSSWLLSSHLDFLRLLTFWLCQPASRLYPPVSCLIIEVSVCLRGPPQYLLIKASVCVCLFISGCYSRHSPGALMRHKPPLPTEAYTVSCHCTSTHSKHCQNEILSLSTPVALEGSILCCLSISLYILWIYIYPHICLCWSPQSVLPPHLPRDPRSNERHARGCFLIKIHPALFLFHHFPLYTHYTCIFMVSYLSRFLPWPYYWRALKERFRCLYVSLIRETSLYQVPELPTVCGICDRRGPVLLWSPSMWHLVIVVNHFCFLLSSTELFPHHMALSAEKPHCCWCIKLYSVIILLCLFMVLIFTKPSLCRITRGPKISVVFLETFIKVSL